LWQDIATGLKGAMRLIPEAKSVHQRMRILELIEARRGLHKEIWPAG
jgi:hypothetical protein